MRASTACREPAPATCKQRAEGGSRLWDRLPWVVRTGQLSDPEVENLGGCRPVKKILAGLMSRWMMPAACAASRASATNPDTQQCVRVECPPAMRSFSVVPSRISMAMNALAVWSPTS